MLRKKTTTLHLLLHMSMLFHQNKDLKDNLRKSKEHILRFVFVFQVSKHPKHLLHILFSIYIRLYVRHSYLPVLLLFIFYI